MAELVDSASHMAQPQGRPGVNLGRWIAAAGRRHSLPILLLLLLGFVAPLLTIIGFSFMPPRTFSLWQWPSLENYRVIIEETFYTSFLWSLGMAVVTVAILIAICYPVAYGLAKTFGRWSNLVTLLMVLPLFVSENVRLYGWVLFFIKGGVLLGTIKSLFGIELDSILFKPGTIIFGMVYVYLPFMLFPMTLGVSMVPRDLVDAAKDLGASRLQIFREVELPLAMPGIVIGSLLTFVLAVGAIAEAKVLGGQSVIPVTHDIEIAFTYAQNWPLGAGISVMLILIVGALVLAVLRRFDLDRILGRR
ncbi:MAG TPA: ABC transporter permease [Hypericibacter adhaerens]|jgi:spermidine/putrescine transport system permease protein|uniref:Spermidine/putrescine ABC transporter permease n=1 Tax=Hypericibacter adhaerens TaxID=2602016 RepID=A0A5J6N7N7_9PROT|nr:ABC transporter permease [Hypericibacter adhaerens]QEX24893.1 spermidine/putrescine ABC transporter permease [Hypericibacter adhaerens]HWA45766.1 ABC transporter permease [Hypericibacter adhaerens]